MKLAAAFLIALAMTGCQSSRPSTVQASTASAPFDLKGVRMGMTIAEVRALTHVNTPQSLGGMMPKDAACTGDNAAAYGVAARLLPQDLSETRAGIVHCIAPPEFTLGNARPKAVLFNFIDGKLYQVMAGFEPASYRDLSDSFKIKFGAVVDDSTNPTAMRFARGFAVAGEKQVWARGDDVVILLQGLSQGPTIFFINGKQFQHAIDSEIPKKSDL